MIERGQPKMVVSDNGSELTSKAILTWAGDMAINGKRAGPQFSNLRRGQFRKKSKDVNRSETKGHDRAH